MRLQKVLNGACQFFMLNSNSQEVVVKTFHKEPLNSNFLLVWELCLDEEMVPIWGQPVLHAGALLGNSPLAGEAGWTQLKGRHSRWRRSVLKQTQMHEQTERIRNSRERMKIERGKSQNQNHAWSMH